MKNYKLGNFICELREDVGMDQKTLAALLGVSSSAISQCENGGGIKIEKLYQLSELFGVTLDELLSGKRHETPIAERLEELYYIDESELKQSIDIRDYKTIICLYRRIEIVRERFDELIYKMVFAKITAEENTELEYLMSYYSYNIYSSKYFTKVIVFLDKEHLCDYIRMTLLDALGCNDKNSLVWELNKIFSLKVDLHRDAVLHMLRNDNRIETEQDRIECLIALYEALPSLSKDLLFSQIVYHSGTFSIILSSIIKPLIERGAKLLYLPIARYLMPVDEDVIDALDGNTELDRTLSDAIAIYQNNFINEFEYSAYIGLTYDEYRACINDEGMRNLLQLVNLWYSDKNAYWETYKTLKLYDIKANKTPVL